MSEKIFTVKLEDDNQVIGALTSNGAAFQSQGGAPLMLTEAVENSSDAIEDNVLKFGFTGTGSIAVKINRTHRKVLDTDNGTGIRRPIYIAQNPFKSLKTGVTYQVGQFGRGLWGFWGFCNKLTFITRRHAPSQEEIDQGFNSRTIKLTFERNSRHVKYETVADSEFEKYCDHKTGTVAIYTDWMSDDFDTALVAQLKQRLQHHFGELVRKEKVEITVQVDDSLPEGIGAKEYDEADLYPMSDIDVKDKKGNVLGKIQFRLYKTSPKLADKFRKPFLLVKDRPLQDSFIGQFPEFQHQSVWSSPYVKGFVRCDFVKPNPLRVALEAGPEKEAAVKYLREAAEQLELLVAAFRKSLIAEQSKEDFENIAFEVQSFLKNKKDLFNFQLMKESGLLINNRGQSRAGVAGRGGTELEVVNRTGSQSETILVAQNKRNKKHGQGTGGGSTGGGARKPGSPDINRDGKTETDVKVDPSVKKHLKGRKTKTAPTGPGLVPESNEFSDELSWYLDDRHTVVLNTEHKRYKSVMDLAAKGGLDNPSNAFIKKKDAMVAEQYLFWIVKKFTGLQRDETDKLWFDLKYEYAETH